MTLLSRRLQVVCAQALERARAVVDAQRRRAVEGVAAVAFVADGYGRNGAVGAVQWARVAAREGALVSACLVGLIEAAAIGQRRCGVETPNLVAELAARATAALAEVEQVRALAVGKIAARLAVIGA